MGYTLHLQKLVKQQEKKINIDNPCITSLKNMRDMRKNTWKKKNKHNDPKMKVQSMPIYGVLPNLCPFFQYLLKLCLNYTKLIMLHPYYAKVILLCPSMQKFSTFFPFMLNF